MASWATRHIESLLKGETVKFRPHGNSMEGKVSSGQLVTVEPQESYAVDDIVLCTVGGTHYLHLIKAIKKEQYQIGNNKGNINGWTHKSKVYGKCISIED